MVYYRRHFKNVFDTRYCQYSVRIVLTRYIAKKKFFDTTENGRRHDHDRRGPRELLRGPRGRAPLRRGQPPAERRGPFCQEDTF